MQELPLIEGVLNYIKENNILFCMPGHKAGKGMLNTEIGKNFYENIIKCDMTEVEGLDNLHNAEGIIKKAEDLLKDLYGSKKAYFLVNGSTSGNLAMIFSAFNEGDKVIVERNCHRSIFNGIIMRKLKPIYIKNKLNKDCYAPLSIDEEHLIHIINENKDAKGIIITYPNYYGICPNLPRIIKEAKKFNMKVIVDSAHGAHFGITKKLPLNAVELKADMVVMSSHKTLPSFTQTAYLHVNNEELINKVNFYTSSFTSTSPSYMLMCSMDYGRYYLQNYGEKEYDNLINICNIYREKINKIPNFHILSKEDLKDNIWDLDNTRYIINLKKGFSGHKLLKYLRENGIQGEMSDCRNVILIFSPFNTEDEFKKLYNVLLKCNERYIKEEGQAFLKDSYLEIPKAKFLPCSVFEMESKKVNIKDSLGKVSKNAIVPYPPGVPILMPGEIINKDIVNLLQYNIKNNIDILGLDGEYIDIVQ